MEQLMLHAQVIANSPDDEIHRVLQRPGSGVERGHAGKNHRAGFGAGSEITKLNGAEGRFARHHHEPTALLEMDVSGPMNQVLG